MTNVDKALLLAEWDGRGAPSYPTPFCCPCCSAPHGMPPTTNRHEPDCVMDLALSERGFYSQEERDRARHSITRDAVASAPTLPPAPHVGKTTTHVLFEGQPLCGFMAGHAPKDWPSGHNWVSIVDLLEREPGVLSVPTREHCDPCERCLGFASATTLTRSRA